MSQIIQPNPLGNASIIEQPKDDIKTGQNAISGPLPQQLQNAHIRPNGWSFKRLIAAIFTFGFSEKLHKDSVQVAANPQPHLPPMDADSVEKNHLPQLSPDNDKLLQEAYEAYENKAPFPYPLKQAEQDAMNRLRAVLGEENVPQGATVHTLFSAEDSETWSDYALSKKHFDPAKFSDTIYEYGLKFHNTHLAHTELAKMANKADPSFQPSASSIEDAIEFFKIAHPAKWEQILNNQAKEKMQEQLSQMPELLYLVRLYDKEEKCRANAYESICNSVAKASGLPLDDVKQQLEISTFKNNATILNSKIFGQYRSEGFSFDAFVNTHPLEQMDTNYAEAANKFIARKQECYDKLNEMQNLDKSVKDALARFILANPAIKSAEDIEGAVKAILNTNLSSLINYTSPDKIIDLDDTQIMALFDMVGRQIDNELRKMGEHYLKKDTVEVNVLLQFVFKGLSAKYPLIVENIENMSKDKFDNLERKMAKRSGKYMEEVNDLRNDINELNKNIQENKTSLNDKNLNKKAKTELTKKINADEQLLEQLNSKFIERSEINATVKLGMDLLCDIRRTAEDKFLGDYFSPKEARRSPSGGLPNNIRQRLDGILVHGKALFQQYGANFPKDKQAEFRLYLGSLNLGTAKDVPQEILTSIEQKARELAQV